MATDAIAGTAPTVKPPVATTTTTTVDTSKYACSDGSTTTAQKPIGLHSPPDSNSAMKLDDSDDSELSELEDPGPMAELEPTSSAIAAEVKTDTSAKDTENSGSTKSQAETAGEDKEMDDAEEIEEVIPADWSGAVPIFKPTMSQFKDFKKFMGSVNSYGMTSGIIKIIPPEEWKNRQPNLSELVKHIRVREPIKQDIMGSNGTYRQVNFLHQRSYNVPQWRQLCDQTEHQPPAKRGERRAQPEKAKPITRSRVVVTSSSAAAGTPTSSPATNGRGSRRRRGGRRGRGRRSAVAKEEHDEDGDRPLTPISPKPTGDTVATSIEKDDPGTEAEDTEPSTADPAPGRMGARVRGGRQAKATTQSTSARRKYARREGSARIDEEAFKDWDYKMDISEYTPERCEELERVYWKTLTYAPPLYGADLAGTLFDDRTESWNLNKLPNILDVLGTKVPGVNTAYLYLGMWKATFAWHLEDVDLYSINYLHFGAPKQWYSISQKDARRFEAAMKSVWPTDAKACDQFLRHKAFLISPNHLLQHFNIRVNKCVSYPGEFVVTYPYGYHSGYNLGYNCAEAVNFALDSWLPMGKIAKKCECAQAQDSVWIDVHAIERKLRGEETDYEETEDDEDEEEGEDEDEEDEDELVLVRPSTVIKVKPTRKRMRSIKDKGQKNVKKIRLRVKAKPHTELPCCLCSSSMPGTELLPTDNERRAHRICALYCPESWIEVVDHVETVMNVANISKERLDLNCLFCRSKRGACFQCSHKKCSRSYHATCAAAAGVFVEEGEVPLFSEDGTEYKEHAYSFTCRFHRSKRDKKMNADSLDECYRTLDAADKLTKGEAAQFQFFKGDIFAGVVVENRHDEQTFLVEVIPNGDRVEVEWKWLLLPDPADLRLPKASPNAIPMPTSRQAKDAIKATKREVEKLPQKDDNFVEGGYTWAEFNLCEPINQKIKVNLQDENQLWHYLGRSSTEARAQYTEDPKKLKHNPKSNFLDSVPKPPPPVPVQKLQAAAPAVRPGRSGSISKPTKPYQYRPKIPVAPDSMAPPHTNPSAPHPYTLPPQALAQHMATPTSTWNPHQEAKPPALHPRTILPPYKPSTIPRLPPPTIDFPKHVLSQPPQTPQASQTLNNQKKSTPSGTNQRYGDSSSSTYASARFNSSSSSPFSYGVMQPPGLGMSPSPQNGQIFQAQAHERSNSSPSVTSAVNPMTAAAIKPSASLPNQTRAAHPPTSSVLPLPRPTPTSVVQSFPFYQVHHNRDSTKYRTPYASWGGFTNGYEGSLKDQLMRTPDALFSIHRQQSSTSGSPSAHMNSEQSYFSNLSTPGGPSVAPDSRYSSGQSSSPAMLSLATSLATGFGGDQNSQPGLQSMPLATLRLHPAIRARYATLLHAQPNDQGHLANGGTTSPNQNFPSSSAPFQQSPRAQHTSQSPPDSGPPHNQSSYQGNEQQRGGVQGSSTSYQLPQSTPQLNASQFPPSSSYQSPGVSLLSKPAQTLSTQGPLGNASSAAQPSQVSQPPFWSQEQGQFRPYQTPQTNTTALPLLTPQTQQPSQSSQGSAQEARSLQDFTSSNSPPHPRSHPGRPPLVRPSSRSGGSLPGKSGSPSALPQLTPQDLPEVPMESMELIEEIIRKASIASGHAGAYPSCGK